MLARAWARLGRQALRPLSSQAGPPSTVEARPPSASDARPPAPSGARPLSPVEARPPAPGEASPPSTREARPPSTSEARPPSTSEARPPSTSEARPPSTAPPDGAKLLRELCGKIRLTGPITVAEYMREVATNPIHGFYISQEALGTQGHFVTSPEVSQMFGETLAVWYLNEWMKMGEPSQLQLVELGPGKGTLMADILRTLAVLQPDMVRGVTVHLVEVSTRMRQQQEVALCGRAGGAVQGSALTTWGCPVTWHSGLREVPHGFSFFLAHEFLDALPINKYERTADGWREVLVDLDPAQAGPALRWVLARHGTPSCVLLDGLPGAEGADRLELCPAAGLAVREVSRRLAARGGAALLVDYGEATGGDRDTLRAFKDHRQVDPLELPGTADITADVDWLYLRSQVDEHAVMFGPTEQGAFLQACGMEARCRQLAAAGPEAAKEAGDAYEALTAEDKMGSRFKFCSLHPKSMAEIHARYPPAGFTALPTDSRETSKVLTTNE